jgi:hypothetical protein
MALDVERDGGTLSLEATVELTTLIDRHIAPDPGASEKARRIRAGILRGRAPVDPSATGGRAPR